MFDSKFARCAFINVSRSLIGEELLQKIFSTGNALGYQAPGVGRDPSQSPKIWDHLQVFILTTWKRKYPPPPKTLCTTYKTEVLDKAVQANYSYLLRLDLPINWQTTAVLNLKLLSKSYNFVQATYGGSIIIILIQATYGDLVRLDLPRCPPTVLVFDPDMAEQAI